jgi:hypothetical protein
MASRPRKSLSGGHSLIEIASCQALARDWRDHKKAGRAGIKVLNSRPRGRRTWARGISRLLEVTRFALLPMRSASIGRSSRFVSSRGRELLWLETLLGPRFLQIPWHVYDDQAGAAVAPKACAQATGAITVEQVLPPMFLRDIRNEDGDEAAAMVPLGRR